MRIFITILIIGVAISAFGQSNINFYQFQGATPQNNNYNPAVFPNARAFVSLPGISGIDLTINNSFGLSDIFTETGDSTLIDIDRFLVGQKDNSYINFGVGITDLMVGFRTGENGFVTLFANEKLDGTFFYPFKLVNFLWEGNKNYIGQEYLVNDISYDITHYREIGVGYGRSFNILGRNANLGLRLKYLIGTLHSSIQDNLEMSIYTDENDYSLNVSMKEGLVRTAGASAIEYEDFMYMVFNKNNGFGIDLGAQVDVTERLSVGLSVLDLGFINWSEYSETASFKGASFVIEGSTFDDIDKLADAVMDSVENLEVDTVAGSFTTSLNSKIFLNGSYQLTENGYLQATISNYTTQGKMKSAFGVGYLQNLGKWFAASASFTAASQKGFDMGLGLMLRGGFFQTYVSVDHIFNTIDIPQATGVNMKLGINFLFGKGEYTKKKTVEETEGE